MFINTLLTMSNAGRANRLASIFTALWMSIDIVNTLPPAL